MNANVATNERPVSSNQAVKVSLFAMAVGMGILVAVILLIFVLSASAFGY